MDKDWEKPEGVPISGILFGGRRPEGVPLVYEAFNWQHGVFIASGMMSESTAAAEHKGKQLMHDPFAMRPFFGYNFGKYLEHWLNFGEKPNLKLPKIFHVNWFRKENGKFLWPGKTQLHTIVDKNSAFLSLVCSLLESDFNFGKKTVLLALHLTQVLSM